jgi:arginase
VVGAEGFELSTYGTQNRRATRLRYAPTRRLIQGMAAIEKPACAPGTDLACPEALIYTVQGRNGSVQVMNPAAYTVFEGRVGDHNDLAMPGARAIGAALRRRTGVRPVVIGTPEPARSRGWQDDLAAALPALRLMQARFQEVMPSGAMAVTAMPRCAVAMATLPVVAKHHPSASVVWFDSHADLNTPASTTTGYLGGLAFAGPLGLWETGLGAGIDLGQVVLVGQRDLDPFEAELILAAKIPHIKPGSDLGAGLRQAIAGRPVYVHLDCDVLNPGIVPTDYVCDGGLTLAELKSCAEVIADHKVIGIEIAEFQVAWSEGGDPVSPDPLLEALSPLLTWRRG